MDINKVSHNKNEPRDRMPSIPKKQRFIWKVLTLFINGLVTVESLYSSPSISFIDKDLDKPLPSYSSSYQREEREGMGERIGAELTGLRRSKYYIAQSPDREEERKSRILRLLQRHDEHELTKHDLIIDVDHIQGMQAPVREEESEEKKEVKRHTLSVGLSGAPVSEKPKAKITEIIAAEKLGLEFATFGSPVLGNKEKYLEDIKLVSKNFQLTGRGLTYSVKEDEEVYDYYHLTLDGLLSPHQTIQEYEGQHDDRYMRTTQYTIEARPILMDFSQKIPSPLRVSEDTEVVIVDTQPKEFKGETKYSEGIQYGVEIGVGAAGPVPTAAGKGNMTVSHVKERVYSDIVCHPRHSPGAAHIKWDFEVHNIHNNSHKTSTVSISSFTPYVQWLWKIKREWAEQKLYKSVNDWVNTYNLSVKSDYAKKMFAFQIALDVNFKTARNGAKCLSSRKEESHIASNIIDHIYCIKQPSCNAEDKS